MSCPGEVLVHPRRITNPPGRALIDYRIGDYASFRHALGSGRDGETALTGWHPGVDGDLASQLIEWWAYLADILAFYNERALSAGLLRTATEPEDIRRIIRLLGYRPRPGIGATGVLAALADSARPFTLVRGLPFQGPGGAGQPPQVFELDDDVEIGLVGRALRASARLSASGEANVAPAYPRRLDDGRLRNWIPAVDSTPGTLPTFTVGVDVDLTVEGIVTNLAPKDLVVVMPHDWDGVANALLARVKALEVAWNSQGSPTTKVSVSPTQNGAGGAPLAACALLKPSKTAHLWLYHERYPGPKVPGAGSGLLQGLQQILDPGGLFSGGISSEPPQDAHVLTSKVALPESAEGAAHLEGITRGIKPGDPVLFEQLGGTVGYRSLLTKVTGYTELIWYANPPESDRIGQGPPIGPPSGGLLSGGAAPIPIPHSRLSFKDPNPKVNNLWLDDELHIKTVVVHYAWEEVGAFAEPARDPAFDRLSLPQVPDNSGVPSGARVLIEDVTGAGTEGTVGRPGSGSDTGAPSLVGPLRALLNLLPVSRGQSVAAEVIGSGDPTLAGQEFPLGRLPLTYLADARPGAFDGYASTLRIRVGGIEWHEVGGFYGQRADARVFATREDDQQRTHVRFGDGEHGARLPAGVDNVVADYRVGSGSAVPPIGTLTTILRPQPGLASIRNPIAPGGGGDPDPPEQIRRYAPRSVLTFGRAVSGDDYETVAALTPGVDRARVVWGWDAASQRTGVRVLVGDDDAAVAAAREALRAFSDPNRPIVVALATPVYVDLTLVLEVHPDEEPERVRAAVGAALLDPLAPPFGSGVVRIGSVVYDSQIYDACLEVPGVAAVHGLAFRVPAEWHLIRRPQVAPGFDARHASTLQFAASGLRLDSAQRHAPGSERYYLLGADGLHIATEVSRNGR